MYDFNGDTLEMLESLYKQSQEIPFKSVLTHGDTSIPNLTLEGIINGENQELIDYYNHVVMPLLRERYLHADEITEGDMFRRVASAVAANDYEEKLFYYLLRLRLFMPSSPTLMNTGREKGTLSSCFVIIPEDDMRSIASYWKNMSIIQKYGGGVGTDWSALRPAGDPVAGTDGTASGFAPFLAVANEINTAIKQGSARSGANASTMRYDHPDIMKFIDFKRDDPAKFGFFNLSVTFTDKGFMKCWNDEEIELKHNGKIYSTINGRAILERMAENAWLTGDPSPYFLDRTNSHWRALGLDKLSDPFGFAYGDRISHNPCGEQNLPNYGVCNLGSVNLLTMLDPETSQLDIELLSTISKIGTIFLDRVIDVNWYPNWKIERQSKHLRNIGLGYMGLSDVFYANELDYGSEESILMTELITETVTKSSIRQSLVMGEVLGEAPVFIDTELNFRNSDFTCIAPTGSIAMLSLCNHGIEPYFATGYKKLVYPKGTKIEAKYIDIKPPAFFMYDRAVPKTSHQITPKQHIDMLAAVSLNVTNAVSKTINLSFIATKEDILNLYKEGFDRGVKSMSVFRDGCREDLAIIVDKEKEEKCCAAPVLVFTDGCTNCTTCGWSACTA